MEFDVTNLDKVFLIQTLYAHAEPAGLGKAEYSVRDKRGENIVGLTTEECEEILKRDTPDLTTSLIDYCKGKPIKLSFDHRPTGKIFVSSSGYDSRNGRYRFLEALLNVFDLSEIIIIKKGYPQHLNEMIEDCTNRPIEEIIELKNVIQNTVKYSDNGVYWKIDTTKIDFKPQFMREI